MQKVHTTLGIVNVFNVLRLLDKSAKLFRNRNSNYFEIIIFVLKFQF